MNKLNDQSDQSPFDQFFQESEQSERYWLELTKLEFTEAVLSRMKEMNLTKAELASRLNAQPSFVTRLLNGKSKFDLATMVRLCQALDCSLKLQLQARTAASK